MSISPNQSYTDSPNTQKEKQIMVEEEIQYYDFPDGCVGACQNAVEYEISESRMSALKDIMEALTDPDIYMMGVCGMDDKHRSALLKKLKRRVRRDNLFDVIVMLRIGKKPNLRRIQQQIADELGVSFRGQGKEDKAAFCIFPGRYKKAVTENATRLSGRIRTEPKILFILDDLQTRLDLAKLGIPFGVDHQGCKLILASQSEEILSNQMNIQRTFRV